MSNSNRKITSVFLPRPIIRANKNVPSVSNAANPNIRIE